MNLEKKTIREYDQEPEVQQKFKQALTQGLMDSTPQQRHELQMRLVAASLGGDLTHKEPTEEEMEEQAEILMENYPPVLSPEAAEALAKNQVPKTERPNWAMTQAIDSLSNL